MVGHVVGGETARILLHVDVEEHLHQHIAQFLADRVGIVAVERVRRLISLLEEFAAVAQVRLLAVPRTAARRAQNAQEPDKIVVGIGRFTFKMYHISFLNARVFSCISGFFCGFHRTRRSLASLSPFGSSARSSFVMMRSATTSAA